jgi:osmoprotectant transport system ATP-binding protein
VLHSVDLRVRAGALCALVGPSGSGKSTLLRLVNRLVEPSAGTVRVRGKDVAGEDPARLRRSIGYAIQSVGLFPHRTVAQNIGTVPRLLGWDRARIAARVEELLALVRLDPGLAGRYPAELSGGQAQRVGLARALAADPDILLMDEPFGAVDPIARRELRAELRRIHAATGKTVLLVTHDPGEALELATDLAVLREGRVVAAGSALELTAAPVDGFVRELIGGGDLGLKRLGLLPVRDAIEAEAPPPPGAPAIDEAATLLEALSRMVEARSGALAVLRGGVAAGSVSLRTVVERHP